MELSSADIEHATDPTADYRRRARRLRAAHAMAPARLHEQLGKLNAARDRAAPRPAHSPSRPSVTVRRAPQPPAVILAHLPHLAPETVTRFADHVRVRLEGPVLRYDERIDLLRLAEHLGIRRFDANLIIASVQHHAAAQLPDVEADRIPSRRVTLAAVAVAVVVQSAILTGCVLVVW